ncbi:hypothetical protein A2W14_05845 [Candidatus Gottesmanbacteria bacterium RBG_16_37_8]|uniref:Uncharacterized protein n=1 Tax=Candidatus Gottesmanbacteria bacterium RBG_16_37_8 TaxID=1798371 RepID=A0A1F5YVG1_9BACT|nr:MAG: hypothetical protein A2W14_05845 [Candidatus Gottesmanbacteria bacterium RBG_16_37_8]
MDTEYIKGLIKGKITEIIFQEMFKQSEEFTVIPIGYEYTVPELAQYQHHIQVKQVLNNIRNAPDFVLISQDKKRVFLVEVKYRVKIEKDEILTIAKRTVSSWSPCFIFIATKYSFYFSPCSTIILAKGSIEELRTTWVKSNIQKENIEILQEFIK